MTEEQNEGRAKKVPQSVQQHLANERTFLSWARTGIALMGFGFLAIKLHFEWSFSDGKTGDPLIRWFGVVSILLGISLLPYAAYDYSRKKKQISDGYFHAPGLPVWVFSMATALLGAFLLLSLYLR